MTRLVHFTDDAVADVESRTQDNAWYKPEGFWVSDEDDETSWSEWCQGEGYGIGSLAYAVTLSPNAGILWLRSAADVISFDRDYGPGERFGNPDWRRVAEQWQGIVITPYQWTLRLSGVRWYYPWDCASGCIWDASAIESVQRIPAEVAG